MSTGALNGTVVVCPWIVAVAVPVATSAPFTSETLVTVGTTLMLVGPRLATASGSALVIKSKAIAVPAEIILFLTVTTLCFPPI